MINSHGRFAWYELMTMDVGAATAFYAKVLGWSVSAAPAPGQPYALLSMGNAMVGGAMELPASLKEGGAKPGWVGYVGVDDVDAAAEQVVGLGGVVQVPPMDVANISRFSVFSDPQMARLALFKWQQPPQQRQINPGAPGHVGWHELVSDNGQRALAFYGELFGWQGAGSDVGEGGTYQRFALGEQTIGGIISGTEAIPAAFWLYYFNVRDIDQAAQSVIAEGGHIFEGPLQTPGGSWIVQCTDPQGAMFGMEGTRHQAVGYFEEATSSGPSKTRVRRWSW